MATSVQQAKDFQNKMNTAVQGALVNIINICTTLTGEYNAAIKTLAAGNPAVEIPDTQIGAVQELDAVAKKLKQNNFQPLAGGSRRRFRKRASARGSYRKRRYSRG